jgi:hypothetical protein
VINEAPRAKARGFWSEILNRKNSQNYASRYDSSACGLRMMNEKSITAPILLSASQKYLSEAFPPAPPI